MPSSSSSSSLPLSIQGDGGGGVVLLAEALNDEGNQRYKCSEYEESVRLYTEAFEALRHYKEEPDNVEVSDNYDHMPSPVA